MIFPLKMNMRKDHTNIQEELRDITGTSIRTSDVQADIVIEFVQRTCVIADLGHVDARKLFLKSFTSSRSPKMQKSGFFPKRRYQSIRLHPIHRRKNVIFASLRLAVASWGFLRSELKKLRYLLVKQKKRVLACTSNTPWAECAVWFCGVFASNPKCKLVCCRLQA